jgi:hypothetical protein
MKIKFIVEVNVDLIHKLYRSSAEKLITDECLRKEIVSITEKDFQSSVLSWLTGREMRSTGVDGILPSLEELMDTVVKSHHDMYLRGKEDYERKKINSNKKKEI